MRQEHRAGEKLFVDYSGKRLPVDRKTGEVIEVEIFVAVLGATNYTYAEATWTQGLPRLDEPTCAPSSTSAACAALVSGPAALGRVVAASLRAAAQRTYEELADTTTPRCCRRGRQAEGQGQGRDRRAGRAALDPRLPA